MMVSIQSCVQRGGKWLRELPRNTRAAAAARGVTAAGAGLVLSAAGLGNLCQPFCLGLLCAAPVGWTVIALALGSVVGYWCFWGSAGLQGQLWTLAGLLTAGLLGGRRVVRRVPLLLPSLAALIVSATGLAMQLWLGDETTIPMYLLRILLAWGSTRLFTLVFERRDTWADWLAEAVAILGLAQISVTPWMGLGYLAAGALASGGSFPAAALAGVALDLAQITPVPMTAVLCLSCGLRLLPGKRWMTALAPAAACLMVGALCGKPEFYPLPGLLLGGAAGLLIPARRRDPRRRGGVGIAQVRLELAAQVLSRTRQQLLTVSPAPVDEEAIVRQAVERACSSCPCRKGCRDQQPMTGIPAELLHRPRIQGFQVPVPCRKVTRVALELQRGQEQLRSILAEREQQEECREAVIQQYGFLCSYLTDLAEGLPEQTVRRRQRYQPEVAVCSLGREQSNGDRCLWFAGTGCRYYVVLCDGMGTGLGAAQEARSAGEMLKDLLSAGFPADHALRSLNSLCALRCSAGAVTVDLAELELDTGRATLYKWGAMPSYLLTGAAAEKIGTAGAPPGLSVTVGRETTDSVSMRRGETLVMLSDGVDAQAVLGRPECLTEEPPGEAAAAIIEGMQREDPDDSTAVVIRLSPLRPEAS